MKKKKNEESFLGTLVDILHSLGLLLGGGFALAILVTAMSGNLESEIGVIFRLENLVVVLIIAEVLFILDKAKPSRSDPIIAFTLWRKLPLLFVGFASSGILSWLYERRDGIINRCIEAFNVLVDRFQHAVPWMIGIVIVVVVLFGYIWLYIWLNSLKYRKK